ncbi:MAG: dihydrofolate reductase [Salaquimonas sp.]
MNTIISIIVAIAQNGVIGAKGGLPWRLSSDLKRFKRDTMGKPIIMGRKTYESIGKALPGRPNIVVSRDKNYRAEGADVVASLNDAFVLADAKARCGGVGEVCLIGGGQLYNEGLAFADRLYVTHVMAEPDGDTFFPEIDPFNWNPVSREAFPAGEKDSAETLYVIYERKKVA